MVWQRLGHTPLELAFMLYYADWPRCCFAAKPDVVQDDQPCRRGISCIFRVQCAAFERRCSGEVGVRRGNNGKPVCSRRFFYLDFKPKIALFFIALFSQFVALGNDLSNQMIIVATPFVVDGLWYTFITLVLSSSKVVDRIRSKAVLIDRLSGIVLMLLALRVVVTV